MILLDDVKLWMQRARNNEVGYLLTNEDEALLRNMTDEQLENDIEILFSCPVAQDPVTKDYGVVYRWYFLAKWADALKAAKSDAPLKVFEVAPGANDKIPQAIAKYFEHPQTSYVTANVDKKLTAGLKRKTAGLPIHINIIEDAAQNIKSYIGEELFDVIAFEHSVNDILYAILGERAGVDMENAYWFDIVQQLTDITTAEYENGTFEANAKPAFLALMQSCLDILKPGGYIVINHFMYKNDLDRGINPELWRDMLPIVREWIKELPEGREVQMNGFNTHWWMFLQKNI